MSFWSSLSSASKIATTALKEAQKRLDKVLDIDEEVPPGNEAGKHNIKMQTLHWRSRNFVVTTNTPLTIYHYCVLYVLDINHSSARCFDKDPITCHAPLSEQIISTPHVEVVVSHESPLRERQASSSLSSGTMPEECETEDLGHAMELVCPNVMRFLYVGFSGLAKTELQL